MLQANKKDAEKLYNIILDCSTWLQSKKIDQWSKPYPKELFSKNVFLGIPLTRAIKEGKFYSNFVFQDKKSNAILSQIRLFDSKRLSYPIGRMSKGDYNKAKEKLIELIQ
ncbi:MAG: hypothetical protein ABIC82_00750 [bacterium]